jgi:hypothetical protein
MPPHYISRPCGRQHRPNWVVVVRFEVFHAQFHALPRFQQAKLASTHPSEHRGSLISPGQAPDLAQVETPGRRLTISQASNVEYY